MEVHLFFTTPTFRGNGWLDQGCPKRYQSSEEHREAVWPNKRETCDVLSRSHIIDTCRGSISWYGDSSSFDSPILRSPDDASSASICRTHLLGGAASFIPHPPNRCSFVVPLMTVDIFFAHSPPNRFLFLLQTAYHLSFFYLVSCKSISPRDIHSTPNRRHPFAALDPIAIDNVTIGCSEIRQLHSLRRLAYLP
jgi:hypothetical protein